MSKSYSLNIIITAAGKGKRMQSKLPKVLLKVGSKSLLQRMIDEAIQLKPKRIFIVVGENESLIKQHINTKGLILVKQRKLDGTAGAAQVALNKIPNNEKVIVVFGDTLVTKEQMQELAKGISAKSISIRTMITNTPFGYSRMVRNKQNQITALVQQVYLTKVQEKISEVDAGGQGFLSTWAKVEVAKIKPKNNKERLLTDLIDCAVSQHIQVNTIEVSEANGIGCNTKAQILLAERTISNNSIAKLQEQGVLFADPNSVIIRGEVSAKKDVFIDKNVILEGEVVLATGSSVGAHSYLKNTKLGVNAQIKEFTLAIDSILEEDAIAGPFAHLREGTHLKKGAIVGNFVETKNTTIGKLAKAKHLSYLGDGEIGANSNIGAGTIFCNYDGKNKHPTILKDKVSIGAGSMLVAPLVIGKNSQVAAGSVITQDITNNKLVFGRARQVTKMRKKQKTTRKS